MVASHLDEYISDIREGIWTTETKTTEGVKKVFDTGKHIFTSGKVFGCFINHRAATSNSLLASNIAAAFEQQIRNYAGVGTSNEELSEKYQILSSAEAGPPLGAVVAYLLDVPFAYFSSKPDKAPIPGALHADREVIIIDDLNTTLGTFHKQVMYLVENGYTVHQGFVNVDYGTPHPGLAAEIENLDVKCLDSEETKKGVKLTSNVMVADLFDHGKTTGRLTEGMCDSLTNMLQPGGDVGFALEIIPNNPEWVQTHARRDRLFKWYGDKEGDSYSPEVLEELAKIGVTPKEA